MPKFVLKANLNQFSRLLHCCFNLAQFEQLKSSSLSLTAVRRDINAAIDQFCRTRLEKKLQPILASEYLNCHSILEPKALYLNIEQNILIFWKQSYFSLLSGVFHSFQLIEQDLPTRHRAPSL